MFQECGLYLTPYYLEFTVVDPDPLHSVSLLIDPPYPTIEMDNFASSDLDLPIAH